MRGLRLKFWSSDFQNRFEKNVKTQHMGIDFCTQQKAVPMQPVERVAEVNKVVGERPRNSSTDPFR